MRSKEELIKLRLPWNELTKEEQDLFNNGFGPSWLGTRARAFITQIAGYFFSEPAGATTIMDIALAMNIETMNATQIYQAVRRDSCKQPAYSRPL